MLLYILAFVYMLATVTGRGDCNFEFYKYSDAGCTSLDAIYKSEKIRVGSCEPLRITEQLTN